MVVVQLIRNHTIYQFFTWL